MESTFFILGGLFILGMMMLLFWNKIERSTGRTINWNLIAFVSGIEFFFTITFVPILLRVVSNKGPAIFIMLSLINLFGGHLLNLTKKLQSLEGMFGGVSAEIGKDEAGKPKFAFLAPFFGKPIIRLMRIPKSPWLHGLLSSAISMSMVFISALSRFQLRNSDVQAEENTGIIFMLPLVLIFFSLLGCLGAFLGSMLHKK